MATMQDIARMTGELSKPLVQYLAPPLSTHSPSGEKCRRATD